MFLLANILFEFCGYFTGKMLNDLFKFSKTGLDFGIQLFAGLSEVLIE